ncbi:hypothetical protein [Lacrimispora saccharolytica]|uniref:PPM-type phosphatase domain-containing protein n=1 Tax=Lacrimispora saccharolytica (strain ATCC 35040 / DSM 2544 / NRCC 2533 / WM1) TaxID=610130 RepID=D9R4Z1_LACSW|nr:hypothetical protein [Lacrimispora saccharolytica]ADL05098.1 conserved hypothetical protein [[Clostridium] saccharolyticum WM1]QRV20712.1 hypothetical protein I6K70_04110 [Lacrimispora saccharolytica]
MAVHIIEQSIIPKQAGSCLCEDGLFVNENFIAVIDGVTSKGVLPWPESPAPGGESMTSGRYAKEVLLKALSTLPPAIDGAGAMDYLNEALARACGARRSILMEKPEERLQAVIILYSLHHREVWAFGDCQCLINGRHYHHGKALDSLLSEVRSLYIQTELLLGRSEASLSGHDTGREYILPLLRRQLLFANEESVYGYDVLNGFPIQPEHVIIYPVPPRSRLVLASDGYPVLKETLAESEAALRDLIEKDPLCFRENKGTKGLVKGNDSFDDRTYICFDAL